MRASKVKWGEGADPTLAAMQAKPTGWRLMGLGLAWLAGVALQLQQRELALPTSYALVAGLGACALAASWRWRRAFAFGVLGLTLLAFGVTGLRAGWRMAESLPAVLEGQDILVDGVVASLPQAGANGVRFRFQVERAVLQGQSVHLPSLLALGWYRGWHEDAALSQPHSELRAGQRWRFTVRLRRPHGNVNPHGFDYELYLFELGVGATGYVRDSPSATPALLLDPAAAYPVQRLRQRVRDAIDASVADRRIAGVLAALAIGDQAAIDRADWDLFRNTGVAHLMSISGLHVTMFAWLAGSIVGALWRRMPRVLLWVPSPVAAHWGGLLAAAAYALLSGWGVPAQRTVWMLAAVTVLQALGLAWPWTLVLLAAAGVVTVVDPWALLQPGFWLSFGAVGLLMVSKPVRADSPRRASGAIEASGVGVRGTAGRGGRGALAALAATVRGAVRTQWIATIGLTPLTLVFFQQVSLVGLVANLVSIPLVTLVITPLALLGALATPLWALGAWVTQGLVTALGALAGLPFAVWTVAVAPAWAQVAALIGATLFIMPLPWSARLLAVPLFVPLLLPPKAAPALGEFELLAADVGQGTAVLVRTRAHLLLYDAGPQYSRDSDAGQRVLLPLLRARGETRIDALVLSHRDVDHVGGARAVMGALPVGALTSSLDDAHPLLALANAHQRCETGQSWSWDGVRFDVVRPVATDYERRLKPNALSCVLRVGGTSHSALLTGDIEREQELALVAAMGDRLRSDVLLVPHHGSRSSSSAELLDAVKPRLAVIQAGYRNRFGHPAADVLQRYVERGITIVDSARCGAFAWPAPPGDAGECWRDTSLRYWRHAPVTPGPGVPVGR
jgi:competence protein ComEC